jgi:hypothetical protein
MQSEAQRFESPSRPIFVLGAERSGRHLLAGLVERWGAFAAYPERGAAGGPHEDFSRQLLAAAGGTMWRPDLEDRLAALAGEPDWYDRSLALAGPLIATDRPWLWTLPTPGVLMPFWERLFPDLICLIAVRSPLDCARSFAASRFPEALARTIQIPAYFSFRWQFTSLTLLALCERHADHLLVGYDSLLAWPAEQVRRLGLFLDRSTAAAESCEGRLEAMLAAVDPGLRHQAAGAAFLDLSQVTRQQKDLYQYLERRMAGSDEAFDAARFAMPHYAWEYLRNLDVFFELERARRPPGPGSAPGDQPERSAA